MHNSAPIVGRTVNVTKRCACVLTLVLVFLVVGIGGMPSREVRAQESLPIDATDTSAAEVEVASAETLAFATAMVSADPSTVGWNDGKTTVTLSARFKTH